MSETDYRLYLCSNCYRRCLWSELSNEEHRCFRCRMPLRACAICDRKFEPRNQMQLYCKRCDFHLVKDVVDSSPPDLDLKLELDTDTESEPEPETERFESPRRRSMAERWQEFRMAAGINDRYFVD
ncbi:uncharacterized protein LOC6560973 [Drosophila grimshawi]|uniref:GH20766 n=1 Tax=Drosophila grimshawi TaxID=7222 RepID=B4J6B9_DROGR|nr:uncharacterized protein LOC6560973 [Drosophila grimshawi]EDW00892.1 GH20766 [Drosophila grimshawi]